jgi:hypothetical protein
MFQDYQVSFSATTVALWIGGILASMAGTYLGTKALRSLFGLVRSGVKLVSQVRLAMVTLATTIAMVAGWVGTNIHLNKNWDAGVGSYLAAAINTRDPQKASKYLNNAVSFLEERGQTDGFTSIAYKTPDEDLNEWATGVAEATETAASVPADEPMIGKMHTPWVQQLIKHKIVVANVTGLDPVTGKTSFVYDLKYPSGIGRAPYNGYLFWSLMGLLLGVVAAGAWTGFAVRNDRLKNGRWCTACHSYHKETNE